jgi:hypothetical protein
MIFAAAQEAASKMSLLLFGQGRRLYQLLD